MATPASRPAAGQSTAANTPSSGSARRPAPGTSASRRAAAVPAPAPTEAARRPSSARLPQVKPAEAAPTAPATAAVRKPSSSAHPAASAGAARPARGQSPTGRHAKPGTGRHARKRSNVGRYVVFSLIGLAVIGAFSYGPITRAMALSKLDSFKGDPAKLDEALVAADAYLKLVEGHPSHVIQAIRSNRGPVEAQIKMAKDWKLFSSLVQIAERPLSDPPPGADGKAEPPPTDPTLKVVSQAQRTQALDAATAIYEPEKMSGELLPDDIAKWANDGQLKRELAISSIKLMTKANPKFANDVFFTVANQPGQDPLRVEAAIDAIAELADASNLGFAIGLLNSRVSDQAVSRTALTDKITKLANPNHLTRLVELLSNPKDAIRAIAIEAMGGPSMQLGNSPEHYRKREELGKSITPKLTPETSPVELAAALKAVKGLRLSGAREAVLALVPKLKTLHLEGISDDFMADMLGKAMLVAAPEPAKTPDAKATDTDKLAQDAHQSGEDLIAKLTALLDDDASRTVAARALGLIGDSSYLNLRVALDKLAAHGEDAECFTALVALVNKTFKRDDITKANGNDLEKWKAFLAADRPRFDRIKEIVDWMTQNKQFQFVKDGKARLTESKDYIAKAQEELDGWMQDKAFVPPLGLTRQAINSLDKDIKMLGVNVRKAWSGALE